MKYGDTAVHRQPCTALPAPHWFIQTGFCRLDSDKKGGSRAAVAVPQAEKFQNKATNPESPSALTKKGVTPTLLTLDACFQAKT